MVLGCVYELNKIKGENRKVKVEIQLQGKYGREGIQKEKEKRKQKSSQKCIAIAVVGSPAVYEM